MSASLPDLMAIALSDLANINDAGARAIAYIRAGIYLHEIPRDDVLQADQAALSLELSKRMEGIHDAK